MDRPTSSALQFIRRYRLRPATQRSLPLFTVSCIAHGYVVEAGRFRLAIPAMGAVGNRHGSISLLDEAGIAARFSRFVSNRSELNRNFQKASQESRQVFRWIQRSVNAHQPIEALRTIAQFYPVYFGRIALYNSLWRYLGNDGRGKGFSSQQVRALGRRRDAIAAIYPKIEALVKRVVDRLARQYRLQPDELRALTRQEVLAGDPQLFQSQQKRLRKRNHWYIYLYDRSRRESVITARRTVDAVEHAVIRAEALTMVQGASAFPGAVIGRVLVISSRRSRTVTNAAGRVMVTSMTHPRDVPMLRRAAAIVTDEGGILSHAAIMSRELHIPCVIGTKIATQVFKDGDRVEVDASAGIVRKLS